MTPKRQRRKPFRFVAGVMLAVLAGWWEGCPLQPQAEAWGYTLSPLRGEEDAAADEPQVRRAKRGTRCLDRSNPRLKPGATCFRRSAARKVRQRTNCQYAVQAHELPQLVGILVLQLLHRRDAAEGHVGQQRDHPQHGVVAVPFGKRRRQTAEQTVLRQRGRSSPSPRERRAAGRRRCCRLAALLAIRARKLNRGNEKRSRLRNSAIS